ncbi:hypothetical protein SAMN05421771_2200 [Granulicella pectinivorans]|jgi:hypothetical protein|uniref:Uncharacterized protein n=1 Tax=Granulicella pectinivorans TaxID=474950 RepID=A0A1I6MBB9_9BACT|nr:hypothetical protein SAMN05421771_2200 [Granulicella pectinivorans]
MTYQFDLKAYTGAIAPERTHGTLDFQPKSKPKP